MTEKSKRSPIIVGAIVLAVAQAIAVLVYLRVEDSRHASATTALLFERVRNVAPLGDVTFTRADGTTLRTSALRGHPVLLHFWATWCPPCRDELPALLKLREQHPELQVIALSLDNDWTSVKSFFGDQVSATVVRDLSGTIARQYSVGALPDTYLLNGSGVATLRFGGARDWTSQGAHDVLDQHSK